MRSSKQIKVTCQVYKWISKQLEAVLNKAGINDYHIQASRNVVLREKRYFSGLFSKIDYDNDPAVIYRFYIPPKYENNLVNFIVQNCELNHPGRGSIYTEEVMLYNEGVISLDYDKISLLEESDCCLKAEFTGITCILQRGLGKVIIKSILDMGFCIPSVTYGIGGGLRDKLSVIRVAVPTEKEIITLIVSKHDAFNVMDTLSVLARLDKPGKGFLYLFPVKKALLNTRIFRGSFKQLATTEQIIQAIDDLKQTNNWRRKFSDSDNFFRRTKIKYNKGSLNLTFFSNEGFMKKIIKNAMSEGARGATVYKVNYHSFSADNKIPPGREMSDLVVNNSLNSKIIESTINMEGFTDSRTIIEVSPVPLFYTYNPS